MASRNLPRDNREIISAMGHLDVSHCRLGKKLLARFVEGAAWNALQPDSGAYQGSGQVLLFTLDPSDSNKLKKINRDR